ncbi:MAG: glycosyltransferase family 1 protein [Bacteroidota bacterium]
MNIGFDGKRAANNLTGLGNYSRSLVAGLAHFFPQNQYFVYTPKVRDNAQISQFFSADNIQIRTPLSKGPLWRSLGIKKSLIKDKIDLFHGLSHEIPVGLTAAGIPSIVTVHDLIFLKFPQYFGTIDRFIYKLKCGYACRKADRIIAISERTKRDIVEFFSIDPGKIEVIYQSCDDSFKIPCTDEKKSSVKETFRLPEKYILSVGTIETRKNLITLVRALKHIDVTYRLVVVGKKTAYADQVLAEIEALGLSDRVLFLENVPFDALPAIYQQATVFVYPSLYEGFGIPILEALHSGVPVVAAKESCLEEAGGPGSLYVRPLNHTGFANAVNSLLTSPEIREKMRIAGRSFAQRFDSNLLAGQMMRVYLDVIKSNR